MQMEQLIVTDEFNGSMNLLIEFQRAMAISVLPKLDELPYLAGRREVRIGTSTSLLGVDFGLAESVTDAGIPVPIRSEELQFMVPGRFTSLTHVYEERAPSWVRLQLGGGRTPFQADLFQFNFPPRWNDDTNGGELVRPQVLAKKSATLQLDTLTLQSDEELPHGDFRFMWVKDILQATTTALQRDGLYTEHYSKNQQLRLN